MFSQDVEGGEYDVSKTIDFNKLDIDTFMIEHNGRKEDLKKFRTFFNNIKLGNTQNMYSELKVDGQDTVHIKSKVSIYQNKITTKQNKSHSF